MLDDTVAKSIPTIREVRRPTTRDVRWYTSPSSLNAKRVIELENFARKIVSSSFKVRGDLGIGYTYVAP